MRVQVATQTTDAGQCCFGKNKRNSPIPVRIRDDAVPMKLVPLKIPYKHVPRRKTHRALPVHKPVLEIAFKRVAVAEYAASAPVLAAVEPCADVRPATVGL